MARMLEALERARQERLRKAARAVEAAALRVAETEGCGAAPCEEITPEVDACLPGEISELIIGLHDHQSPITEQLRQIRTNLEIILADVPSRTIVVSSPLPGDGKTLLAANLATVLADDPEHKVLLADADLRKGGQHALFGLRSAPGLSEYLRRRCSVEEAIHPTRLPNLKVMPAGQMPDLPSVLLGSDRMTTLLGELQRRYHWIVFDSPPILPVTDALVLGRACHGLLLVVRMDRTQRKMIERAQDVLAETRLPVLGCVLNDFEQKARDADYYGKYYERQASTPRAGFKS